MTPDQRHPLSVWSTVIAGSVSLALLSACGTLGAFPGANPPELLPGEPIEGHLTAGEGQDYQVRLAARQFVRFEVEQLDTNIAVSLVGPNGDVVESADLISGLWLPERLTTVVDRGGRYRLRLASAPKETRSGRYRVTLVEARRQIPGDAKAIAADEALQEGLGLQEKPGADFHRGAIEKFRLARELYSELDDPLRESRAILEIGNSLDLLSEIEASLAAHRESLQRAEAAGSVENAATALNGIGLALLKLNRLEEADESFRRALDAARTAGARKLEASILGNQGGLAYVQGDFESAFDHLRQAISMRREIGDRRGAASTLTSLGVIYRSFGRTRDALDAYAEALTVARELSDVKTEVQVLNNIGVAARARGEFNEALSSFDRAIGLARQIGDREWEALAASNLGSLYRTLGDPLRALELHRQALELDRAIPSPRGMTRDLLEIGRLYEVLEEPDRAINVFEQALPSSIELGDPTSQAYILQGMGRSWAAREQPQRSLELLEQALELQRQSGNSVAQVGTLRDLGACQLQLGDLQGASDSLAEARALARSIGNPKLEATVSSGIARLERRRGNLESALTAIEEALSTVEFLRVDVPSPDLRASYFSASREDFALYIDLLVELHAKQPDLGYGAAAFEASERARARTLTDLLTEARVDVREGIAPELLEQERELTGQLSELQRVLVRELSRPSPRADRVAELRKSLAGVKERRRDFELELRRNHPRYAEMRYPEPLNLKAAQGLLDSDTVLLEYFLAEERSYLFAVSGGEFEIHSLPGAGQISALVRTGRETLDQPGRSRLGRFESASRELYRHLVEPAVGLLADKRHLIVSPDGELHLFPFEALVGGSAPAAGSDGETPYLIFRWAVSYVPSASVLSGLAAGTRPEPAPPRRWSFVAFADPLLPGIARRAGGGLPLAEPAVRGGGLNSESWHWRQLPGARREVTEISRLFPPGETLLYLGADAHERNVKTNTEMRSVQNVHFASHAIVDNDQPAYTALLMSDGNGGEDGLLQVHEIFNLRLDADLVVLSACETALGKRVSGEGLIGLTRAFLYAGSRSVSVSLWPVADESTAELMVGFYRRMTEGRPKAEALRLAKIDLIRSETRNHPYYWAPFVLVGHSG